MELERIQKKYLKRLQNLVDNMKYVRIPKDRIGVLIGHKGETKRLIEDISKTKLDIDSEEGEIVINDEECKNPLTSLKTEEVIKAIGRGFSPDDAQKIFKENIEFFLFDIHDYVGKKGTHVRRLKSRIIGSQGKTKKTLEHLTGAEISVYGHTIGVISDFEYMDVTKRAIDMLLSGSKHSSVYRFIEREMKKIKLGF